MHLFMTNFSSGTVPNSYLFLSFHLIYRPRRRSGSSIVVLGGSDSIDDYIKSDTIEHYRITDNTYRDSHDLEMLTMMPTNQDNGKYFIGN